MRFSDFTMVRSTGCGLLDGYDVADITVTRGIWPFKVSRVLRIVRERNGPWYYQKTGHFVGSGVDAAYRAYRAQRKKI